MENFAGTCFLLLLPNNEDFNQGRHSSAYASWKTPLLKVITAEATVLS